jgi:hypothetical protein
VQIATQLFGIVPACFKYLDDEQDMITVTNDSELGEAVAVSVKSKSILRVFVFGMSHLQSILIPPYTRPYTHIVIVQLIFARPATLPISYCTSSHTFIQRLKHLLTTRERKRLKRRMKMPSRLLKTSCATCLKCLTLLLSNHSWRPSPASARSSPPMARAT